MTPRTIPNTALEVSPLCLGTMTFGIPVGEKDAVHIVRNQLLRKSDLINWWIR